LPCATQQQQQQQQQQQHADQQRQQVVLVVVCPGAEQHTSARRRQQLRHKAAVAPQLAPHHSGEKYLTAMRRPSASSTIMLFTNGHVGSTFAMAAAGAAAGAAAAAGVVCQIALILLWCGRGRWCGVSERVVVGCDGRFQAREKVEGW
jgi:hypothetical protein